MPIRKPVFKRQIPATSPVYQKPAPPVKTNAPASVPVKPTAPKPRQTGKKSITVQQLFKMQTGENVQKSANMILHAVVHLKKGGGGIAAKISNYDPYNPPPKPSIHICTVTGLNPDLTSSSDGLKVDCDCERFKFVHDYALHYHGLSNLNRSLNRPPVETNPRYKGQDGFQLCKHLYILVGRIAAGRIRIMPIKQV